MSDILDLQENQVDSNKRPVFLTVLCILTYVGAGIGLLTAIYGLLTLNKQIADLEQLTNSFSSFGSDSSFGFGDAFEKQLEILKKWGMISNLTQIAANGLCLFGALQMWKLKKNGFYIYVIGQVAGLAGSIFIMGGMTGIFASLAIVGSIIGAMFPIAFIVMYALNLKHLK